MQIHAYVKKYAKQASSRNMLILYFCNILHIDPFHSYHDYFLQNYTLKV